MYCIGDSLFLYNGWFFLIFDWDNDDGFGSLNCVIDFCGVWWYVGCYEFNLNGFYYNIMYGKGINWFLIIGYY